MILVDTSVWVEHLRRGNARLGRLLEDGLVLVHPFVLGELAQAETAEHGEVLSYVERHGLAGSGIGWVDVHLLVSAALSGVGIWTLDRRLAVAAQRLSLLA